MPLMVTDYTWTQTEWTIYLNVPLKGAKLGMVDILCTDQYLKIHSPPFLFEAFLSEPVDSDKSVAKVGDGVAFITLPKWTKKMWEHLTLTNASKAQMREIRESALAKYPEKLDSQCKTKLEKREAEKKYSLRTMMSMETEQREQIRQMKEKERERATAEMEAMAVRQKEDAKLQIQTVRKAKEEAEKSTPVRSNNGGQSKNPGQSERAEPKTSKKEKVVPAPRAAGSIHISFTSRAFPTALRESKVAEEEEWLRSQAEARRAVETDLEELKDLKDEERNPDWLKDKGDKCFTAGNYKAALNAYDLAIKLQGKSPALHSNRAACHLKLGNPRKALEDSSRAIALLTPPIHDNASARARAHVRRGSALCQLQLYVEALQDLQAALKIHPQNEALQVDAQRLRDMIQGTDPVPDLV